jgi:hypothetical protein
MKIKPSSCVILTLISLIAICNNQPASAQNEIVSATEQSIFSCHSADNIVNCDQETLGRIIDQTCNIKSPIDDSDNLMISCRSELTVQDANGEITSHSISDGGETMQVQMGGGGTTFGTDPNGMHDGHGLGPVEFPQRRYIKYTRRSRTVEVSGSITKP